MADVVATTAGEASCRAAAPEVTVVIPTRDRWAMLSSALTAALGQRDVTLEVVVVDDGSADETPERLAALRDPRLRSIRHEQSQGVAGARNAGIALARGGWVAFLDDDDLWSPAKLRTQLDVAAARGSSFVYGAAVAIDPDGRPIRHMRAADPRTVERRLLTTNAIRGPSTVIVRTTLLHEVGGFDQRLSALADWDLWLRLAPRGRPTACSEALTGYVQHGANMLITDADVLIAEFEYLASKHERAARALGHAFGELWLLRHLAEAQARNGRWLEAARLCGHRVVADRSLASLGTAIGILAGDRWAQVLRHALVRRTPSPTWLKAHDETRDVAVREEENRSRAPT